MKIKLLMLFLIVTFYVKAQHCGWDFLDMIVIEVKDSTTDQRIDNLKLTLVNSAGNPYILDKNDWYFRPGLYEGLLYNYILYDTLTFNIQKSDTHIYSGNISKEIGKTDRYGKDRHLVMAAGNYFLVNDGSNNWRYKNYLYNIKIEDLSGKYPTTFIPLREENVIRLCSDYRSEQWKDKVIKLTIGSDSCLQELQKSLVE